MLSDSDCVDLVYRLWHCLFAEVPNTEPGTYLLQVGSVVFSGVKEYSSMDSWSTDAGRHLVPKDSPYAFREGEGRAYGWIVQDSTRLAQPMPVPQMKRLLRSIYEMST